MALNNAINAPYVASTSWTPVLTFGSGSTGITYSTQNGFYSRIGNILCIGWRIQLTSKGTDTGTAELTGFSSNLINQSINMGPAYVSNVTFTGNYLVNNYNTIGQDAFTLTQITTATTVADLTDTNFADNTDWRGSAVFLISAIN